jgi:uncharacterized OsmC-like protein/pimeloyl-ACP methyl ester carboxylesterase
MLVEKVEFENPDGHRLSGELHGARGPTRGTVLFAHCFTCTSKSKAAVTISRALAERGFRVLRFDFTGLGDSEGKFADSNFSSSISDLLAAASFLETNYAGVDLLVGHSLGGTAALAAAERLPQCRAVATIAAPARAEHVAKLLGEQRREIETQGSARVDIGGTPFTIKRQFLDDLMRQPPLDSLRRLRCALLVMHAPADAIVEIDNASEIFSNALHPKSFVSLDRADHLLTRNEDADYAAAVIAAWSTRYLRDSTDTPDENAADWVSARTGAKGFVTEVDAAGHALIADEPERYGGTNQGPSPYDLLSSALAACTSMTLQLYARRKNIALDSTVTRVRHTKIHAKDCAECETVDGKVDRFEREIELSGDLGTEIEQRLMEIADRCPVHRTLSSEIRIIARKRSV